MGYSLPESSIHGIFQARILEWVAISFSRRSSQPWDRTWVSCIVGRHFNVWATKEALKSTLKYLLCSSATEPSLSLLRPQLLLTWIIPKACDFCVCFLESSGWLQRGVLSSERGFISHTQFWPCYIAYNYLRDLVLIIPTIYFLDICPPCSLNFTQLHWSFFHCFCTKQFFLLLISSYFLFILQIPVYGSHLWGSLPWLLILD